MSMNRINNPSQLPQGVVEGYQQQSTNMFAARVGLDTTAPFDNGTVITIPVGGVVEVNGVMYSVASEWSQTKPNADTAYWIAVVPSEDGLTASFELVTRPGVWSPERNGSYFTSGDFNNCRTLNWVSRGVLVNAPTTAAAREWETLSIRGRNTASLAAGWKFVSLTSGGGGGNGQDGGNGIPGSAGIGGQGGAGGNPTIRNHATGVYFHKGGNVEARIGADGTRGGRGGRGGDNGTGTAAGFGGGGGGAAGGGEESFFAADGFSLFAPKILQGRRGLGGTGGTTLAGSANINGGAGGFVGQNGVRGAGAADRGEAGVWVRFGHGTNGGDSGNWSPNNSSWGGGAGGGGGTNGWDLPNTTDEPLPGGSCQVWGLGN